MSKLKIGNLELDNNVILAPMAGVTNQAFKQIVRELGAGLICTEMVNDKALLHKNERTRKMVEISENEHPVALQLFGSEIETMVAAAKYLDKETETDIIDINMGCPAPKITKNASGSKILLDPEHVYNLTKAIVDAVEKPVMVKMRIGWDDDHINVLENAKNVERAGADAIVIHGRTTKQFYSGKADWEMIKKVKETVNIPVIGNGDIDSPQKAKEMLEYSKVDGIMIGRAAMGNPWIFKRISHYLETGELLAEPSVSEKIDTAIKHLEQLMESKNERVAVLEMRGHAAWYLKGISGANKYRREIQTLSTYAEMKHALLEIKKKCN